VCPHTKRSEKPGPLQRGPGFFVFLIEKIVMAKRSIKEMIKGKQARFVRYTDESLWYCTDDGFEFPIPIEEAKGGVFKA